jgi:hypothetical protein
MARDGAGFASAPLAGRRSTLTGMVTVVTGNDMSIFLISYIIYHMSIEYCDISKLGIIMYQ